MKLTIDIPDEYLRESLSQCYRIPDGAIDKLTQDDEFVKAITDDIVSGWQADNDEWGIRELLDDELLEKYDIVYKDKYTYAAEE